MSNVDKVRELANNADGFYENYASGDGEYIRIVFANDEEDFFQGVGEVSGESYYINYEAVDLEQSKFFKLMPMN